jgi:hypothetical protein
MQDTRETSSSFRHRRAEEARRQIRFIALVAILAVGLGFIMQALILFAKTQAGAKVPGAMLVADVAQGVTWSVFVCTGVAIGVSIGRARKALAGLIGFLFAPLGVAVAKASQRAVLAALSAAEQPMAVPLVTVGLIRAVEYGMLAWLLAALSEREVARALPYLGVGTTIGVVFGTALTLLTRNAILAQGLEPTLAQIAGTAVNEIGTPIGCAVLIFIGQIVSRNFSIYKKAAPKLTE